MMAAAGQGLISVENWGKIVGAFGSDGLPLPFVKEIFLIECDIAGTTHVADIGVKTADLAPGTLLAFRREPDNVHDSLAIQILNSRSERIGYVPRERNDVLARLMDGGKLLFGRVENKQPRGDWLRIAIKIFLRDL